MYNSEMISVYTSRIQKLYSLMKDNNQRFIRLQVTSRLIFPGYEAELWIKTANLQQTDSRLLIEFWKLYNDFLLEIIRYSDDKKMDNVWVNDKEEVTLDYLISDYFVHLKWHEELFVARVAEITDHMLASSKG